MKFSDDSVVLTGHGVGECPGIITDTSSEMWMSEFRFTQILELMRPGVYLTFDDGFSCCWDIVHAALMERGIIAGFFVTVQNLGCPGYLSVAQVREMSDAGMSIGTHGMRHCPWRCLDDRGLREEIFEAKDRLESIIGKHVSEAACPFGAYDRRTLRALRDSGIERVYTSDRALPDPKSWLIPRYTIRNSDTIEYLEAVVAGKHDATMLGWAKMMLKRFR